ncbi:MAG: hypothetical protein ACR2GG_01740 [Gemmatimonadaceae bacterium]
MLPFSWIAAVPMLLAPTPTRAPASTLDVTAPRSGSANAAGATTVRISARAGYLHIQGRPGITEVRAQGTARASNNDVLKQVQLVVKRTGDVVEVTVVTPDQSGDWFTNGFGNNSASLDLTVEVPTTVPLDVEDGSGDTIIRGTGTLQFRDGSGDMDIDGVTGDLSVDDGSGDISAQNVRGKVTLTDGSGNVKLSNVGSVNIGSDGSGDLNIDHVIGNVMIGSDGSGEIDVSSVSGDFTVRSKGSGSINSQDVKGKVDIPERHRR